MRKNENIAEKQSRKTKKGVDFIYSISYNMTCVTESKGMDLKTGCGSAWLERLVWDQEAAGSNPVTPIFMRV